MKFRTDINFLRALSVLIVMFFHFNIPGFEGGFIGVDVFFVISGFLMTSIILKDIDNNSFSLKEFYAKRIKRLVPALLLLLFFVLVVSVFLLTELDRRSTVKSIFFSDLFLSNILYWKLEDYFNSTTNLLLHTWSLGVEWQFYVIYPLVFWFSIQFFKKNSVIFWLINSVLTLSSLLLMLTIDDVNLNFFMLFSRYWELSLGGFAYLLSTKIKVSNQISLGVFILSIIILIVSTIFINEHLRWPSYYTLLPVLATVLILVSHPVLTFFNSKIINFFGNISYSLYLWHWPLFVLFGYFGLLNHYTSIYLLILISIVLASFSYYYVEKNQKATNLKWNVIAVFALCFFSGLIYLKPEAVSKFSIYNAKTFKVGDFPGLYKRSGEQEKQYNPCGCFVTKSDVNREFFFKKCLKFSNTKPNVLLVGDSHAAQFSSSLRHSTINLLEASISNSLPIFNSNGRSGFKEFNHYIFEKFILENKNKIDLILISAHWLMRVDKNINYTEDQLLKEIQNTIDIFEKNGINFMIIGQTEKYNHTYPKVLIFKNLGIKNTDNFHQLNESFAEKLKKIVPTNRFIDVYDSKLIDHYDEINCVPYMFDDNHLTKYGADQIVNKIILPKVLSQLNDN
jgi:peptidoglycan/LPS O-acetylase OafA/YrhL